MDRRQRIALACIVALSWLVRLAFVIRRDHAPLFGDEPSYSMIATNLVAGRGYSWGTPDEPATPTAVRGPGYVMFLAFWRLVAGSDITAPLIAQSLLGAMATLLLFRIAMTLTRDVRVGLVAALLHAACVPLAGNVRWLITETLAEFLFLAAMSEYLAWAVRGERRGLLTSAVLIGVCTLSKPVLALVPAALALALWPGRSWKYVLRTAVVQLAVVAVVLAPWAIRNAIVLGKPIVGVTLGGFTFWAGTGPVAGQDVGGMLEAAVPAHVREATRGLNEVQADAWFYREGLRVIASNPAHFALLELKKPARLWFNLGYEGTRPSLLSLCYAVGSALLYGLAWMGSRRGRTASPAPLILGALVTYFTLVHVAFYTVSRYVMPAYAYLLAPAAAGIVAVLDRVGLSRVPAPGGGGGAEGATG